MKKSWNIIRYYLFIIASLVVCLILFSCKTEYIPTETIREVYINNTDTFIQHDTTKININTILREARPEDSAMIADLGIHLQSNERLLILLQKQLKESSKEKYEHKVDSFIKTDSIRVPYPVERKLSRFEQFCLDFGKVTTGVTIAVIIAAIVMMIRWIRRKIIS